MGYEIKLYVGSVYRPITKGETTSFMVAAMIDLCCIGNKTALGEVKADIPIYFYGEDGNTQITEDMYDKKLHAGKIEDLLKALETDRKDPYGRFEWAYQMVKAMTTVKKNKHCCRPTHFFLYGH